MPRVEREAPRLERDAGRDRDAEARVDFGADAGREAVPRADLAPLESDALDLPEAREAAGLLAALRPRDCVVPPAPLVVRDGLFRDEARVAPVSEDFAREFVERDEVPRDVLDPVDERVFARVPVDRCDVERDALVLRPLLLRPELLRAEPAEAPLSLEFPSLGAHFPDITR